MAWTAPTTRNVGDSITQSVWNTDVVDNLNALKAPPTDVHIANEGADWTTSSTSFVDVDATDLSLTITTTGGDVLIGFMGYFGFSTNVYLDVTMDGTRLGGDDGILRALGTSEVMTLAYLVQSVTAGARVFKLQWKVTTGSATLYAGAGTSNNDVHPQFWVREVS